MSSTASYRIPIGIQFLWAILLAGALFILRKTSDLLRLITGLTSKL
jgi:hypothetical protein